MNKNCIKLGLACLFSFLIFGNSDLFGQRKLRVGLTFGPLITHFSFSDKSYDSKTKAGFMVELLAAYPLSEYLSLASGIGYTYRNQDLTTLSHFYDQTTGNYGIIYFRQDDVVQQSAQIPIYLRYHNNSVSKGLFLSVGLLPTLGFRRYTKSFTAYPFFNHYTTNEVLSSKKFFQVNSLASIGYSLQGQSSMGISIELYGGIQLGGWTFSKGEMYTAGLRIGIWL